MSLPSVTVTGKYESAAGTVLAGSVSFTPTNAVSDVGGKLVISAVTVPVSLDGTGSFSQVLPATDTAGLTPLGWAYSVSVNVPGAQQAFLAYLPLNLGPSIDITELAPVPGSPAPGGIDYLPNTQMPPAYGPSGGGGFLFALDGALYWMGGDSTRTLIAPA